LGPAVLLARLPIVKLLRQHKRKPCFVGPGDDVWAETGGCIVDRTDVRSGYKEKERAFLWLFLSSFGP